MWLGMSRYVGAEQRLLHFLLAGGTDRLAIVLFSAVVTVTWHVPTGCRGRRNAVH